MPIAGGYEPIEPALAVQIENHPEARPARNLNKADIVIEATVEGDTDSAQARAPWSAS
jgi:hypothetical protein